MTTLAPQSEVISPAPIPGKSLITKLNIVTGLIVGAIFCWGTYYSLRAGRDMTNTHNVNKVLIISMFMWSLGFMIGIGALIGPFRWLIGKDLTPEEELYMSGEGQGLKRYFKFCTDHKVVGIQYLVAVMVLLGAGGTMAMMIRTNLATPGSHLVLPQIYNSLVGLHGITMIIAMIIVLTGPLGNFILPMMIGARGEAFPRLNAVSFWLLFTAIPVLCSAWFLGGIPTGWSAYAPLSTQAGPGMNAFLVTIIIFAISTAIAGTNITTTVITMRAKGMRFNRIPIFVIGCTISVALAVPAFPTFMAAMVQTGMDRTISTGFFDANVGGTGWLYANLFWIMGHPEVYVILLPGVAALLEMLPVFTRKPLFSFPMAIAGMAGIAGMSALVWAHHMYMSGWMPALNGPFMVTTEFISFPTGLLFLVFVGTLWRSRPWLKFPMLCVYAMMWNLLIGGITGVYVSDVPLDATLHGTMFVTAHFHYTIMGGLLFSFFAAIYFWSPKMTGRMLNQRLGKIHFWVMFVAFNSTFLPLFAVGQLGQPRRVFEYAHNLQTLNDWVSVSSFVLGLSLLVFVVNVLWNLLIDPKPAPVDPWFSRGLEWHVPSPPPPDNFPRTPVVLSTPYEYGDPDALPVAVLPDLELRPVAVAGALR